MITKDTCDIYCHNEEKVNRVQVKMQNNDLEGMAKIFKALSDQNRAKITFALSEEDDLCVCDIANIIETSVATASHHLRTLYKQGIVKYRKEGKLAFYSLDDDHIRQLVSIALIHHQEVENHVS
ncbi:ArsR/SmtB family transcription factor [Oceanobacillus iheyensis]|uniref:Cadmium efflux system accessory protein (CadC protein) n=1 Tax=Oceanobacillus iheyensis (strain DSM 14371 / CIP 107618 / JCM 11309 / KCTC 3954 / HTE831) TaxID=221109 RepID=Q8ETI4_OCEIH|nr:metalloregulator ArsR/SmtB family transcription factor [Oceanobacillus iheyensis]BAC12233.1 cadmium efflux system accessory protein (cadC protein) [Oceanobacillus iheyensis HTE831]